MRAYQIQQTGDPEVLTAIELAPPTAGVGELVVRLAAAAINPIDCKLRSGKARLVLPEPGILGHDAAGIVAEVGLGVTGFSVGDAVFYAPEINGYGSYAQYHRVKAQLVAHKPNNLSMEQAASLPLAACTAWDSLIGFMQLQPGDQVLIHAAAGGVGSLAVQLAKAAGAEVIATVSQRNRDWVAELGAAHLIDYQRQDFVQECLRLSHGRGVDAVYDTVGGDTLARSIDAVRCYGKIASIVSSSGDLNRAYIKNLQLYFGFMQRSGDKMRSIQRLVEQGLLRPLIDRVLPLSQVATGHRLLEQGGVRGKIVLHID